jgi:hypothetical protein
MSQVRGDELISPVLTAIIRLNTQKAENFLWLHMQRTGL